MLQSKKISVGILGSLQDSKQRELKGFTEPWRSGTHFTDGKTEAREQKSPQ